MIQFFGNIDLLNRRGKCEVKEWRIMQQLSFRLPTIDKDATRDAVERVRKI